MKINRALIEKYNQPVPRYTSYPPANFFTDSFTPENYMTAVEESNGQKPENISIYIHIPFCKKLCFYCGCNSTPMAEAKKIAAYVDALKKEISLVLPKISKERKISQIHYGGGTPNAINAEYLHEINQLFFDNFSLVDQPEIAIECHPAYLTEGYILKLKHAGFNRFSLGIQDFNREVLKNVNREPSTLKLKELTQLIRRQGNISVNFDFIYGLPGQTASSFKETLEQAILLKPDRLVTFSYAHVPWVNTAQKVLERKGLPDANDKIGMFETAYNLLTTNDYASIGMDHYVLKTDELYIAQTEGKLHRNFQGYCTRRTTGQVYAFGVSGISQLQEVYAQNTKSVDNYIEALHQNRLPIIKGFKLNAEEQKTRDIITDLMCNKKLSIQSDTLNNISNRLDDMEIDGLVQLEDRNLKVTESGMLFIRNVAALFDPLIGQKGNAFSKSV